MHRIIRLHPYQQGPRLIQHVHSPPRPGHHITIRRHLQPIRRPLLTLIYRPFVGDVRSVALHVEGEDDAGAGGVEGGAKGGKERGDGAGVGAGVGDVNGGVARGDGDAVGLSEGVFDDVDGAGGRAETVGGGGKLWGSVGEFVEPGVFWGAILDWVMLSLMLRRGRAGPGSEGAVHRSFEGDLEN